MGGQRGDPQMRRLLSLDPLLHTLDTALQSALLAARRRGLGAWKAELPRKRAPLTPARAAGRFLQPSPPRPWKPQLLARPCTSGPLLVQAPRCPQVGSSPSHVLGSAAAGAPWTWNNWAMGPQEEVSQSSNTGQLG